MTAPRRARARPETCGRQGADTPSATGASVAGADAGSGAAGGAWTTGGGWTTGGTSNGGDDSEALARAAAAATRAADEDARCDAIADTGSPRGFYWEIGDSSGVLASDQRGAYSFDTVATVASATKVLTAAYFLERDATLADTAAPHLNFTSGYVVSEQTCPDGGTVSSCYDKLGGDAVFDAALVGSFHYGPAHMQKLAVGFPDLAPLDAGGLAEDFRRVLHLDAALDFEYPALASGVRGGPALFRELLQRLVRGEYRLRDALGRAPQCTLTCATPTSSPADEPWSDSLGHWVEDDAAEGLADGSFTGLGAAGFYIWVDRSRRYYGLLGRWALPFGDPVPVPSALCGQRIRAAFLDTLGRSAASCGTPGRACAGGELCCAGRCADERP